jgi:hypothetical protein
MDAERGLARFGRHGRCTGVRGDQERRHSGAAQHCDERPHLLAARDRHSPSRRGKTVFQKAYFQNLFLFLKLVVKSSTHRTFSRE